MKVLESHQDHRTEPAPKHSTTPSPTTNLRNVRRRKAPQSPYLAQWGTSPPRPLPPSPASHRRRPIQHPPQPTPLRDPLPPKHPKTEEPPQPPAQNQQEKNPPCISQGQTCPLQNAQSASRAETAGAHFQNPKKKRSSPHQSSDAREHRLKKS